MPKNARPGVTKPLTYKLFDDHSMFAQYSYSKCGFNAGLCPRLAVDVDDESELHILVPMEAAVAASMLPDCPNVK